MDASSISLDSVRVIRDDLDTSNGGVDDGVVRLVVDPSRSARPPSPSPTTPPTSKPAGPPKPSAEQVLARLIVESRFAPLVPEAAAIAGPLPGASSTTALAPSPATRSALAAPSPTTTTDPTAPPPGSGQAPSLRVLLTGYIVLAAFIASAVAWGLVETAESRMAVTAGTDVTGTLQPQVIACLRRAVRNAEQITLHTAQAWRFGAFSAAGPDAAGRTAVANATLDRQVSRLASVVSSVPRAWCVAGFSKGSEALQSTTNPNGWGVRAAPALAAGTSRNAFRAIPGTRAWAAQGNWTHPVSPHWPRGTNGTALDRIVFAPNDGSKVATLIPLNVTAGTNATRDGTLVEPVRTANAGTTLAWSWPAFLTAAQRASAPSTAPAWTRVYTWAGTLWMSHQVRVDADYVAFTDLNLTATLGGLLADQVAASPAGAGRLYLVAKLGSDAANVGVGLPPAATYAVLGASHTSLADPLEWAGVTAAVDPVLALVKSLMAAKGITLASPSVWGAGGVWLRGSDAGGLLAPRAGGSVQAHLVGWPGGAAGLGGLANATLATVFVAADDVYGATAVARATANGSVVPTGFDVGALVTLLATLAVAGGVVQWPIATAVQTMQFLAERLAEYAMRHDFERPIASAATGAVKPGSEATLSKEAGGADHNGLILTDTPRKLRGMWLLEADRLHLTFRELATSLAKGALEFRTLGLGGLGASALSINTGMPLRSAGLSSPAVGSPVLGSQRALNASAGSGGSSGSQQQPH
ncbi:hypothetical protein H9P43_004753 [Blastocladiella emersonii ATCC 22665]|nr:hypothetical protein H9P43_004753 [Blastocladiella emersonii ATCC 22665]